MRYLLLCLLLGGIIGCGDPGKGKHKESLQDIPQPEEKKNQ